MKQPRSTSPPAPTTTPVPPPSLAPTSTPAQAEAPAIGAQLIAYIGPDNNVWLINGDGTDARQLTVDASPAGHGGATTGIYSSPAWSPDSARLYFIRLTEDAGSIFVYDMQSELLESIGPQDRAISSITASPDGERLAYIYDVPSQDLCPHDSGPCLALLDLGTGASTDLICDECGWYGWPDFSPDGSALVMTVGFFEWWGVALYPLRGSEFSDLESAYYCRYPGYSPDGTLLWAICSEGFMQPLGLYTVDPETGERALRKQWGPEIYPGDLSLSADGTHIAYTLDDVILFEDLTTGESRPITGGTQPAWRPLGMLNDEASAPSSSAQLGTVKVGILAPLSGDVAIFGQSTRDGALLAVEEWNTKGVSMG